MRYFFFILLLLFSLPAFSAESGIEDRCRNLYEVVRCPTCGGQSIKDSNSQIAQTLRDHIKREVLSNKSDDEILSNLKAAYGDQIVNTTSIDFATLPLWLVPIISALLLLKLFRVSSFFNSKTR